MTMPSWVRSVLVAVAVGGSGGLVVGGLGARTAMRLIAVAEPAELTGARTLSGGVIGELTWSGTADVLMAGLVVGVLGGLLYLAVRGALPRRERARAALFAAFLVLVPGAVFSRDSEFRMLERPLLALAVFLPVFVLYGLLVALVVERYAPAPERTHGAPAVMARGVVLLTVGLALTLQVVSLTRVSAG
ncbi:hypothetical protein [Georgenia yuyongxinii]|uniref:Uncharacterized protein n=1 Tax=Georgenia yuyongxinii TaxID=2589797 RepID=A0A552WN53_9MICO|nr:hypothetical protein [Georgenia yuyongxinii]TRW44170.1 hypothetical protein FJ693_14695 [Georgenia yuyongxinii]